jgi:hypothetical protein
MRYAIVLLALGALTSPQASAGELQSVYVAPGGIYIASGNVNVGTANGYPAYGAPDATYYAPRPAPPAYAPGYVAPGPCTEHPHIMKDIGRRIRRARPILTGQSTPTLMRRTFRRGRLLLCPIITATRIVHSIQLMAGRHIVTDDAGTTRGGFARAVLGRA